MKKSWNNMNSNLEETPSAGASIVKEKISITFLIRNLRPPYHQRSFHFVFS